MRFWSGPSRPVRDIPNIRQADGHGSMPGPAFVTALQRLHGWAEPPSKLCVLHEPKLDDSADNHWLRLSKRHLDPRRLWALRLSEWVTSLSRGVGV